MGRQGGSGGEARRDDDKGGRKNERERQREGERETVERSDRRKFQLPRLALHGEISVYPSLQLSQPSYNWVPLGHLNLALRTFPQFSFLLWAFRNVQVCAGLWSMPCPLKARVLPGSQSSWPTMGFHSFLTLGMNIVVSEASWSRSSVDVTKYIFSMCLPAPVLP